VYCQKGSLQGYVPKDYLQTLTSTASSVASASSSSNTTTTTYSAPTVVANTTTSAATTVASTPHATTSLSIAATQAQSNNKDIAQVLIARVEEDAKSLPTQTAVDYQALLRDFKQDIQKQLQENERQQQLKQKELEQLKSQLDKTVGTARTELESRITSLEENQALLMQDYQAQQSNLAEKEHILNQPELARFYRTVQNKLQQIFLAYKVIGSGMVVSNALTTTDKAISVISLAGESIPLPGSKAVATWLGYAIKAGVWLANKKQESTNDAKIAAVLNLNSQYPTK